MLTKEELLRRILLYHPTAKVDLINKAYDYALRAHGSQVRESGDPYISHPIAVAEHLMKLKARSSTICAALLHDVVEDTTVNLKDIETEFGSDIASLVDSVTKIDKVYFTESSHYKAENLRKILLATAKDVRVMLIKLCDRLHNMETAKYLPVDKRKAFAEETLKIYSPIAHKLGIYSIKGKMEDFCLKILEPQVYAELKRKISAKRDEREEKTKEIITNITRALQDASIESSVKGRAKYFYSIYHKMKEEHKSFDDIYDLIAVRIIVRSAPECYAAVRIIHSLYPPLMERFKDFIKTPKPNSYQSIHTTVKITASAHLEVQVRTKFMDHNAEEGVAAHWRYKKTDKDKKFDRKISWLKQLLAWREESMNEKSFEDTIFDLFKDEIVVFTPKGDPITLPEGSTPIDFAYEVHSNIGNTCTQAKVNTIIVRLDHELHSGDVVEIITRRNVAPNRQWLSFAKSHLARNKIRQSLGITVDAKAPHVIEPRMTDIIVKGKQCPLKISGCCSPKAGEAIVGYYTKDHKITVHRYGCANASSIINHKKADIEWSTLPSKDSQIVIVMEDKVGVISELLDRVSRFASKVYSVTTKANKNTIIIAFRVDALTSEKEFRKTVKSIPGFIDLQIQKH